MSIRNRGAAGLAAIAALALLLELAALFALGPRLVAQLQRSAPEGWVTAATVTGRALGRAATLVGSRAVDAAQRVALRREPEPRILAMLASRECIAGVGPCTKLTAAERRVIQAEAQREAQIAAVDARIEAERALQTLSMSKDQAREVRRLRDAILRGKIRVLVRREV